MITTGVFETFGSSSIFIILNLPWPNSNCSSRTIVTVKRSAIEDRGEEGHSRKENGRGIISFSARELSSDPEDQLSTRDSSRGRLLLSRSGTRMVDGLLWDFSS